MLRFTMDEAGFGDERLRLPWSELSAVAIRTSADGPWAEDVFWQFLLRRDFFELPASQMPEDGFEVMGRQLPGLAWEKVARAMASTGARVFHLWSAEGPVGASKEAELRARFVALVERLRGSVEAAPAVFEQVNAAWNGPARAYHGSVHLSECLRELDRVQALAPAPDVLELALWYHDVVYRPTARDNEAASAKRLGEDALLSKIPSPAVEAAQALVLATALHGTSGPSDVAADFIRDIDLAIFGRDMLRVMEFESEIDEEYASVPRLARVLGRGRLLTKLLEAPTIYRTPSFRERYEAAARAHIRALLQSPRYRAHRWFGRLPLALAVAGLRSKPSRADERATSNKRVGDVCRRQ